MKTKIEWFELMPLDIKEKALEYTKQWNLIELQPTFKEALLSSFVFSETKEGHDFWWDISLKY